MTLVITMIRPEGVFQSADFRVQDGGRLHDDMAPKQIAIHAPPLEGGPRLLLAFTGLAELADGTPLIQWVRETLRGETRTMDGTLAHLRDRLDRDVSKSRRRRCPLILTGGILEPTGRRLQVEITNVRPSDWAVRPSFTLAVVKVDRVGFAAGGSGARYIGASDRELLLSQAERRPRRLEDHLRLLAAVNRRAAARDPRRSVSPWCQASYITTETDGVNGRVFTKPGEVEIPLRVDTLIEGIDPSVLFAHLLESMDRKRAGLPQLEVHPDDVNRQTRPRP